MLKITDPAKRDLIVKEYLEITKNIRETQKATANLPHATQASGEKEDLSFSCIKSC